MEKLHVQVGFVFTQVMFCDGRGKVHFHRVMTDVDKPWRSVKEVLELVKGALGVLLLMAVQVEFQYRQVHFSSLLASLREELTHYLDKRCQLTIQVFEEEYVEEHVEEPASMEEEIYEEVYEEAPMDEAQAYEALELEQTRDSVENRMFPIYREADATLIRIERANDRIVEAWDRKAGQPLHFFVEENGIEALTEFDQRGSPDDWYA